jgi:hypothetical protein
MAYVADVYDYLGNDERATLLAVVFQWIDGRPTKSSEKISHANTNVRR